MILEKSWKKNKLEVTTKFPYTERMKNKATLIKKSKNGLLVKINDREVNVIFQRSGDIDFEYTDGSVMDCEDPNFEAVSELAYTF